MKHSSRRLCVARLLLLFSAVFLISAAVLMTVAMLLEWEAGTNYFSRGAVLPVIAVVLSVCGGLSGAVSCLLLPREAISRFSPAKSGVTAGIPAVIGFAGFAIGSVFFADGAFSAFLLLFSVLSAASILLSGLPSFRSQQAGLLPLLGVAPVVTCALITAYSYFDLSVEMNAPVKIPVQISLLLAMLCFTEEIRFSLQRPMPRLSLILAVFVISSSAATAAAFPVAFVLRLIPARYFAGALLSFGIALTLLMRIAPFLAEAVREKQISSAAGEDTAPDAGAKGEPK